MSLCACVISVLLTRAVASANVATAHPASVGFLKPSPPKAKELSSHELLDTILAALDDNDSNGYAGSLFPMAAATPKLWDLHQIEDVLKPIVAASPKNQHGRLGDAAARYALHRLFMERHGWEIRGFGDAAIPGANSSMSPSQPSVFEHWVPEEVRFVLEGRVLERGFGILELSVFAASLEHLIRGELSRKLQDVYRALGVSTEGSIDSTQAEALIDLYMGAYIRAEDLTMLSPVEVFKFQTDTPFVADKWDETRNFFREIQESVVPDLQRFTFEDVAAVLQKIETNFVYWNQHQCEDFKDDLMGLEQEVPGRVRLLDFYDAALHKGMYRLAENRDYLQQLGVVDEADPLEPRLILSNYVDGPSNCVARNSYYSVCCMDQCADLYNHVERRLGKPEATAEEIISVVFGLCSATATTCSMLPDHLQDNLYDIADANGGQVSLHGKAFAEWMHFVYPRECVWPQKFGPAHEQTVEEWEKASRMDAQADTPDLMRYIKQLRLMEQKKNALTNSSGSVIAQQQQQQQQQSSADPLHLVAADDEPPMIGGSKRKNSKKRRLQPASATTAGASVYWWLGPALGALYGAALGVVKLLSFRSESLRNREPSCSV